MVKHDLQVLTGFEQMCNADATYSYSTVGFLVSILFCIICWCVSYNSADYGGGASACKLVAPFFGLWDLRRCLSKHQRCTTRECGGFDAQTAQAAYLFVISQFFVRLLEAPKWFVCQHAFW